MPPREVMSWDSKLSAAPAAGPRFVPNRSTHEPPSQSAYQLSTPRSVWTASGLAALSGWPRRWFTPRKRKPACGLHTLARHWPFPAKECQTCMDSEGRFIQNTAFALAVEDFFHLGVPNASVVWALLQDACAASGDATAGGRIRFLPQYLQSLPIPDAKSTDRDAVAALAREAQKLHGQRRARGQVPARHRAVSGEIHEPESIGAAVGAAARGVRPPRPTPGPEAVQRRPRRNHRPHRPSRQDRSRN